VAGTNLDDLVLLDGIVGRWRETGRLPGGWTQTAGDAGLVWADDVSFTARTQYRSDYELTLADGTKIVLGPHLRAAPPRDRPGTTAATSDEATRRVVVGHVGRHLRDRTSAA
jgi:hypothetical protein